MTELAMPFCLPSANLSFPQVYADWCTPARLVQAGIDTDFAKKHSTDNYDRVYYPNNRTGR